MNESGETHSQHSPGGGEKESGIIDALLVVAPGLLENYQRLIKTNQYIFQTELKIVLKSTLAIVLCSLIFLTIMLSLWLGLNLLIAVTLWSYFPSILGVTIALVSFNTISTLINLKLIGFYAKQFNFRHTLMMLGINTE